jgi:hypothetical protein
MNNQPEYSPQEKAYLCGFDYGTDKHGRNLSPRDVDEMYPQYTTREVDAFLDGVDDGVRNDPWILNLIHGKHK